MGNWNYPRKQKKMKLIVQRAEQIQSSTQIFMTPSMGVVRMQKWNVYKVHIQIRELLSSWIFLYIQLHIHTGHLQSNYIAQAVLRLHIKLIQVFSYFTEQRILEV